MWRRPASGATKQRHVTTNWTHGISRPSPTTRRNSGSKVGEDPDRARWLAERNLQVRQTPRVHEPLTRATLAGDRTEAIYPARDGNGA